mmetsp:Transcript_5864/g.17962  ORF Transcript_5864/g.17962 Transcript_5864/m.17962 type:complete len:362 (-) Transcript_5864:235-1320(-)
MRRARRALRRSHYSLVAGEEEEGLEGLLGSEAEQAAARGAHGSEEQAQAQAQAQHGGKRALRRLGRRRSAERSRRAHHRRASSLPSGVGDDSEPALGEHPEDEVVPADQSGSRRRHRHSRRSAATAKTKVNGQGRQRGAGRTRGGENGEDGAEESDSSTRSTSNSNTSTGYTRSHDRRRRTRPGSPGDVEQEDGAAARERDGEAESQRRKIHARGGRERGRGKQRTSSSQLRSSGKGSRGDSSSRAVHSPGASQMGTTTGAESQEHSSSGAHAFLSSTSLGGAVVSLKHTSSISSRQTSYAQLDNSGTSGSDVESEPVDVQEAIRTNEQQSDYGSLMNDEDDDSEVLEKRSASGCGRCVIS